MFLASTLGKPPFAPFTPAMTKIPSGAHHLATPTVPKASTYSASLIYISTKKEIPSTTTWKVLQSTGL